MIIEHEKRLNVHNFASELERETFELRRTVELKTRNARIPCDKFNRQFYDFLNGQRESERIV